MRLTPEEKSRTFAVECEGWIRSMRQAESHADLDRQMAFVRSQYKPRGIADAIRRHFEETVYPETSEALGPRPKKPKFDPATGEIRDHKMAAAKDDS